MATALPEKDPIIKDLEEKLDPFLKELRDIPLADIEAKATAIKDQLTAKFTQGDTTASATQGGFITAPVTMPADYITSRALSLLNQKCRECYFAQVSIRYTLNEDRSEFTVSLYVGA